MVDYKMQTIDFQIEHIDPMGQGVCKSGEKINFVSKALPGEEGQAKLFRQAKGVQFSYLENPQNLTQVSKQRIEAHCPHYNQCGGCQYLHTDYSTELSFKQQSLAWRLKNICDLPIESIAAPSRSNYRNRIQLHYDLNSNKIGLIHTDQKQLVEVPNCQLPLTPIAKELKKIYTNSNWCEQVASYHPPRGHVELYQRPGSDNVQIIWNQAYSAGEFSQVNPQANQILVQKITDWVRQARSTENVLIDLFGGQGNLSQQLEELDVFVIDQQPATTLRNHQTYRQLDLYAKSFSWPQLTQQTKPMLGALTPLLLVDPPRKGIPTLSQCLDELSPKHFFYVSCDSASLARDLKSVQAKYSPKKLCLIDLFPGTKHFETLVWMQKKAL